MSVQSLTILISAVGFIVRTDTQNYILTEAHGCYSHARDYRRRE